MALWNEFHIDYGAKSFHRCRYILRTILHWRGVCIFLCFVRIHAIRYGFREMTLIRWRQRKRKLHMVYANTDANRRGNDTCAVARPASTRISISLTHHRNELELFPPFIIDSGSFDAFRWLARWFAFSWLQAVPNVVCLMPWCDARQPFKYAYFASVTSFVQVSIRMHLPVLKIVITSCISTKINEDDELHFSLCIFSSQKTLFGFSYPIGLLGIFT